MSFVHACPSMPRARRESPVAVKTGPTNWENARKAGVQKRASPAASGVYRPRRRRGQTPQTPSRQMKAPSAETTESPMAGAGTHLRTRAPSQAKPGRATAPSACGKSGDRATELKNLMLRASPGQKESPMRKTGQQTAARKRSRVRGVILPSRRKAALCCVEFSSMSSSPVP